MNIFKELVINPDIGAEILQFRTLHGYSLRNVAPLMGVSRNHLWSMEKGTRKVTRENLERWKLAIETLNRRVEKKSAKELSRLEKVKVFQRMQEFIAGIDAAESKSMLMDCISLLFDERAVRYQPADSYINDHGESEAVPEGIVWECDGSPVGEGW